MILQILIAMIAGWLQRHQQHVIAYLLEENRILKAQLGNRRLRLSDTERRRHASLAHPLSRQCLKQLATLATPATLMRWYKSLSEKVTLWLPNASPSMASWRSCPMPRSSPARPPRLDSAAASA
jgi:hypothetical protein